jgi:hypothetical protein
LEKGGRASKLSAVVNNRGELILFTIVFRISEHGMSQIGTYLTH